MKPIVRYMLLCDDARVDPDNPACTHIDCLMSNIVSLENPPFPLVREMICVYVVLTGCHGNGMAQIRVVFCDPEPEQLCFAFPPHLLDFAGHSPLASLGVVFRLEGCLFPHAGRYSVQFWYNDQKVEERPLRLR
jgi:uncharacterized protein DUF6941